MPIALHDLRRHRLRHQPQPRQRPRLQRRRQVRVGPDRAGDLADRDLLARRDQASPIAHRAGEEAGEDHPERGRLGVDPVRPPDDRRPAVLPGAPAQRGAQAVDPREDLVDRAGELQRQRGVEHVGGGHPEVQPACVRPGQLLDVGQKRDDVVAGLPLDFQDPRRIELSRRGRAHSLVGAGRNDRPRLFGHRGAGGQLHLEPALEAARVGPQGAEIGPAVAVDQGPPYSASPPPRQGSARARAAPESDGLLGRAVRLHVVRAAAAPPLTIPASVHSATLPLMS